MKYLAAVLLLVSINVSAQTYGNEVWINTGDALLFYQSCWTVVDESDYNGSYCYGEYTTVPGLPYTYTSDDLQKRVVIFGMEADVPEFINDNCFQTNEEVISPDQTNFYFDCVSDEIFKDGFD